MEERGFAKYSLGGRFAQLAARACLSVSLAAMLTGCSLLQLVGIGKPPPPAPAPPPQIVLPEPPVPLSEQSFKLSLQLTASADINPDARGRPSPVRTLIFLTEETENPAVQPFEEIFGSGENSVTPKAISTVTMRPGKTINLELRGVKTQNRLTIAAAYREPYKTQWTNSRVFAIDDQVNMAVRLSAIAVSVQSRR